MSYPLIAIVLGAILVALGVYFEMKPKVITKRILAKSCNIENVRKSIHRPEYKHGFNPSTGKHEMFLDLNSYDTYYEDEKVFRMSIEYTYDNGKVTRKSNREVNEGFYNAHEVGDVITMTKSK